MRPFFRVSRVIQTCTLLCLFSGTPRAFANLSEQNQMTYPNIARAFQYVSSHRPALVQNANWHTINANLNDPLAMFNNWLEDAEWASPLNLTLEQIQMAQVWMLPAPESWMSLETVHQAIFHWLLRYFLNHSRCEVNPTLLVTVLENKEIISLIQVMLQRSPQLAMFIFAHLETLQGMLTALDSNGLLLLLNLRETLAAVISRYLDSSLNPRVMLALLQWLPTCDFPKEVLYDLIIFVHYCLSAPNQLALLSELPPKQLQAFFAFLAQNYGALVNLELTSFLQLNGHFVHVPSANLLVAHQLFDAAFHDAQQELEDHQIQLLQDEVQALDNTHPPVQLYSEENNLPSGGIEDDWQMVQEEDVPVMVTHNPTNNVAEMMSNAIDEIFN